MFNDPEISNPFALAEDDGRQDLIKRAPAGSLAQKKTPNGEKPATPKPAAPKPVSLSASVGDKKANKRSDVAKTEGMLARAGTLDLNPTGGPTGNWGARAAKAAKKFQKANGLKVDGVLGRKTTDAFNSTLMSKGSDELTKSFGQNLGFA